MKKIIALLAAFTLTACATGPDGQPGQPLGKMESTALHAGIGCLAGATVGAMMGNSKTALKACAGGAVLGGVAGFALARERELAEVKTAAAEIPRAQVETQKVVASDQATGEKKTVDAFKTMAVPMDGRYATTAPEGRTTLVKLSQLSAKNGAPVTVSGGSAADRDQVAAILRANGAADVRVDNTIKTSSYGARGSEVLVVLHAADRRQSVSL